MTAIDFLALPATLLIGCVTIGIIAALFADKGATDD